MAFITNGCIALFSSYAYTSLKHGTTVSKYWKQFYLMLAISSAFGMYGHTFFQYTGILGKTPSWLFAAIANVCAGIGMLELSKDFSPRSKWVTVVWVKTAVLFGLSLYTMKFIGVAIDAILTYILYTGCYAYILRVKGLSEMKFMIIGVLILLPSAVFFLLKLNPHRWLNKDDISHILILGGIICFYISLKKLQNKSVRIYANV